MPVGDYSAVHFFYGKEVSDPSIFERKEIGDCFTSFTAGYEQEKAKWTRAQALGLTYILAIEASASDVLKGHSYWTEGEVHEAKKSGLAMIRQLMTLQRKYGLQVWFCTSRREMAWRMQEYFLAWERLPLGGEGREREGVGEGGEGGHG